MTDILGGDRFISAEPIEKGWSEDKKYCVTDADGVKYLLRISPTPRYEVRKSLFDILKQVAALGIPMCLPIEFGACDDGVYTLHSWIDGEDLENILPLLSETEQYVLGLKSGEILRKMHSIPAPDAQEEWAVRFNRKTNHKIKTYRECGIRFDGDDYIVEYIENNRCLLENRPQCFQHGDYHVGNMMMERGELKIIDFDRYDFGDPWEEFNRIVWCAAVSPHFATGQLRGYFGGEPPLEFFKLLAFYIASNTLSSIYWAIPFGQSDIDTMLKQSQDVLSWYDNMQNPVPSWYLNKYEIWDVLDANGNKTGRYHERGKPMAAGDYHLAVHAWKHNGRGEWLIDKRTPEKGGKWETTGGAAIAGDDSLTTALRETKEELGLDLDPAKGTLFRRTTNRFSDGHSCLIDDWVFEHDCTIEDISFNENETCEAMWATAGQIRELMEKGEFLSICPYFDEMAERWGRRSEQI
jgi:aminoglycoside phosphotransferase (APT) family kinase protein/8-oxo-dGTP pyrophosphatase MutT (NUDIX family)